MLHAHFPETFAVQAHVKMSVNDLNTASRGRSAVPDTRARIRLWRRARFEMFECFIDYADFLPCLRRITSSS
jgi:hypothetical protein